MDKTMLEKKVENFLDELKDFVDREALSPNEVSALNCEIDKVLYECLYYKSKLVC